MVGQAKFGRGAVVMVDLNPGQGEEQKCIRPALVLSAIAFNAMGTVLVAPITQSGDFVRHAGLAASLTPTSVKTAVLKPVFHYVILLPPVYTVHEQYRFFPQSFQPICYLNDI